MAHEYAALWELCCTFIDLYPHDVYRYSLYKFHNSDRPLDRLDLQYVEIEDVQGSCPEFLDIDPGGRRRRRTTIEARLEALTSSDDSADASATKDRFTRAVCSLLLLAANEGVTVVIDAPRYGSKSYIRLKAPKDT